MVIPGGNLGNVSALAQGPRHAGRARADRRARRASSARRRRRRTRSTSPTSATSRCSSRSRRGRRSPRAIQIGNPVSIEKAIDALQRYDGIVEQASEEEIAESCARADRTGPVQLPAHGRGARGDREARGARRDPEERPRGRDLDRARAQVRRLQGEVPRDAARRDRLASGRTRRSSCPPPTRWCATACTARSSGGSGSRRVHRDHRGGRHGRGARAARVAGRAS